MNAPVFPPPARSIRTPRRVNIGRAVTIDYTYALQPQTPADFTPVNDRLDALEGRMDAVEDHLEVIDGQIQDLQDQIDALTGTTHRMLKLDGGKIALADLSGFLRLEVPVGR